MTRFNVGDVVTLKSGGDPMTVTRTRGDDVDCVWFGVYRTEATGLVSKPIIEYDNEPSRATFVADQLVRA